MSSTLSPMSPERARAVRLVLVTEASRAPAPATHPVRSRPRARRALYAVAAAGLVAVPATLVLTGDPAPPEDYATWTAMPETGPGLAPPPTEELEMWASQCTELTGGGVAIEGVPADPAGAAERKVLIDRRGEFTLCVDMTPGRGTPSDPLIALAGITGGDNVQQMSATVYDKPVAPPSSGGVTILSDWGSEPVADGGAPVDMAYGVVGSEVTDVLLRLADGTRITATVDVGLWAAWWPPSVSTAPVDQLVLTTDTGTRAVDPGDVDLTWD